MVSFERRYDIDWLRVIAVFLLIIYHIAIIFQPWALQISFIQSEDSGLAIWAPMSMFNIWRIPLLFFISGMGFCFAMRKRNWKELLSDRIKRILLPLVFGSFAIVPVHIFIFQYYYDEPLNYYWGTGHLWFLSNICMYILQLIGLAVLDKNYDYKFFNFFRKMLEKPYTIFLFMIPFVFEGYLIDPAVFTLYAGTGHGFILGTLCFYFGFLFVAIGDAFWKALGKVKLFSLIFAVILYLVRLFEYELNSPAYLQSLESINWIFAIFGYAQTYLNKPGKYLKYFNESVYPVYILHMIFMYLSAYVILPLELPVVADFFLIIIATFITSYAAFELLRRIDFIRPLFGMTGKLRKSHY